MGWFSRDQKGIQTPTDNKKEMPEGLWHKCSACGEQSPMSEHEANLWVCGSCGFHDRIAPKDYFSILFDTPRYKTYFNEVQPKNALQFEDLKPYEQRLKQAFDKTDANEAVQVAVGRMEGRRVLIAAMDFRFIGGSMGSVVGERMARGIDFCIENKLPCIIISKSGGARMMEAGNSLMQMIKITAKLNELSQAGLPYISLLTDPTTGGVTASFAMLGDVNVSEPGALIAFAGPRVVKETIKQDLPEGFQRAEFLLEKGFLDKIIRRENLKESLAQLLSFMMIKAR
ncbi:MAG: acetyl-CoA carboxylase, carboxyltransferase subunit beta [Bacteroidota bacterium]|nr:acetyl-CoA carboxylase, carboxyltransferase subunit beta [Bacteroidota bacterium]MEC8756581.1 acetyl-CoA carboxylase, carboxyltransferase subunit beta [Bacteroidota bacterium]MEC8835972.1 acetyl-CoA carboxylase, carboxyltransferase subunit beta [Bacteroidota bacterium]|tara:strand:- start:496 stop:1350 length:855 start_codon:yes stop_codon:yes gene_type:complete